jgi:hypothetical protein
MYRVNKNRSQAKNDDRSGVRKSFDDVTDETLGNEFGFRRKNRVTILNVRSSAMRDESSETLNLESLKRLLSHLLHA